MLRCAMVVLGGLGETLIPPSVPVCICSLGSGAKGTEMSASSSSLEVDALEVI